MMCMKDMLCEAKNKVMESKDLVLTKSIDASIGIAKKGSIHKPIKSFSMHKNSSTPLWKIVLITLSVMAGIAMLCHLCQRRRCDDNEE